MPELNPTTRTAIPAIAVVIVSAGRPDDLHATVEMLFEQTLIPDEILLSTPKGDHVRAETLALPRVRAVSAPKGITAQRNAGADAVDEAVDVICFLDDDVSLARDYLETVSRLFAQEEDVVLVTGAVLADGVKRGGLARDAARRLVETSPGPEADGALTTIPASAYGCNMSVRRSVMRQLRFDERLPLYGWLEDRDFSHFCSRLGRTVRCPQARIVHLGVSAGRTSGLRYGYSQIMNSWYLYRKGSLPQLGRVVATYWARPFLMNLARSVTGDRLVDRRGRLRGNLRAFADILRGRVTPERIVDFED